MLSIDVYARDQFLFGSPLEDGMSVEPDEPVFLVSGFTLDVKPILLLVCYQLLWNVEGEGLEAKFMQDYGTDWLHMDVMVQPMHIFFPSPSPTCGVCYHVKELGDREGGL
jgi:hypothetical protein